MPIKATKVNYLEVIAFLQWLQCVHIHGRYLQSLCHCDQTQRSPVVIHSTPHLTREAFTKKEIYILIFCQLSGLSNLLSASSWVISPSVFLPIKDECSDFWHVARKHGLHAWDREQTRQQKACGEWGSWLDCSPVGTASRIYTYFRPFTAL